jgi:hypothetical protein
MEEPKELMKPRQVIYVHLREDSVQYNTGN